MWSIAFLRLLGLGRPLKCAYISLCWQLKELSLYLTTLARLQLCEAFLLRFEGGQWSLSAWLVPCRKLWFSWRLQTDQQSLNIKWTIPDGRKSCLRSCGLPTFLIREQRKHLSKGYQYAADQSGTLHQPTDQGFAHLLNCVSFSRMEYRYLTDRKVR